MVRKSFPAEISVNMLSELTGKERRTIRKRLEGIEPAKKTKKGSYYEIKTALKAIFEPMKDPFGDSQDDEENFVINPQLEKARLDKARRISVELDNEIKKKNLIPKQQIKDSAAKIFGAVRSKFLNFPLKASQSLPENPTRKQLQAHLTRQVNETLKDLSEKDFYESL